MQALKRIPGYIRALHRNNRRETNQPRFLTHTVTFTCNARCIMCDSWKLTAKGDLTLDEIERIYAQLPTMDAVRLTGGEPFVRKDLLEIAHLVQRRLRPFFLHITSNGFLTDRIVTFCERREKSIPLQLLISIDGLAEKHNHVRGRDTAWETATRTLKELAPRRKELNLSLAVNQTIVDAEGAEHYRLLREELRPLGIHNHFVMAYDTSATYNLEREKEIAPAEIGQFTTFGEFSQEQLRDLLDEVESDLDRYPLKERLAKRYYMRGIRNRLLHGHGFPNPKCVALSTHMRLFPNGDVPTCQFNSKTVGNLREQSFAEVWQSARADHQRQWVRRCPGCWAECEVLPNAIYTGDLLKETFLPARSALEGI
ncbi:radical SAM protein [bacterium]|nr:radical SAM protein [bacterium]